MDLGPEHEGHHHSHTGVSWLDMTLGVSAVVISLVSLFLAIQHGKVMEKMVEATTWPFVMTGISTANPDGTPHVMLEMENKGVGPAKIESLELAYKGAPVADTHQLMQSLIKGADPAKHQRLLLSDIVGSVLSSKERINFVDVPPSDYSKADYEAMSAGVQDLTFRTCYCSVFDECWILDTAGDSRPHAVKVCPVPKTPFRHQ